MVRTGTVVLPGSDAAVFLIREANKFLAATTDCNSLYCALDPREGARIAIAEAARNLTCSGAVPLAVTDNLNFGNPHKPENFWQLRECVEGLAEGCRAFDTPVTGGNVSLYNESPAGAIDPTPTVGMVGLIAEERHITTQFFKDAGDVIILVGEVGDELGASRFLKVCHGRKAGLPPRLDIAREMAVQNAVRELIRADLVKSAHDCSEGGLAVALAESCFNPDGLLGAASRWRKRRTFVRRCSAKRNRGLSFPSCPRIGKSSCTRFRSTRFRSPSSARLADRNCGSICQTRITVGQSRKSTMPGSMPSHAPSQVIPRPNQFRIFDRRTSSPCHAR